MRNVSLYLVLITLILDQVTKSIAAQFGLTSANPGIAFGWMSGWMSSIPVWLNGAVLLVMVIWWLYNWRTSDDVRWGLSLVVAGGVSNWIDRVRLGAVVDWIPVPILGLTNNIADYAVVLGLVWLVWIIIYGKNHCT